MIDYLKCLTLSSLKENHLEFKIMDAREKNKIKCKEYYLATKDNLTPEQKERRKETARKAQRNFYYKNKELCKLRIYLTRYTNEFSKEIIENKLKLLDSFITEKEILFIKSLDTISLIKKAPRLTMWNKVLSQWTFKDFNKLLTLI